MPVDPSFNELNRASTERMRALAARLTDEQLQTRVGEHWTVAIVFAHLAFWDRRVMYVLDMTAKQGTAFNPDIDIYVNDLSLLLWAAVPPREATRIAIENAKALDKQLEAYPPNLLELVYELNQRRVIRARHRNQHLDKADAALTGAGIQVTP